MAKTCLIDNPVRKSLGICRLESLRFVLLDNIAIQIVNSLLLMWMEITQDFCHYCVWDKQNYSLLGILSYSVRF